LNFFHKFGGVGGVVLKSHKAFPGNDNSYVTLVRNIQTISPDFCVIYQNFLGTLLH